MTLVDATRVSREKMAREGVGRGMAGEGRGLGEERGDDKGSINWPGTFFQQWIVDIVLAIYIH